MNKPTSAQMNATSRTTEPLSTSIPQNDFGKGVITFCVGLGLGWLSATLLNGHVFGQGYNITDSGQSGPKATAPYATPGATKDVGPGADPLVKEPLFGTLSTRLHQFAKERTWRSAC